MPPVPLPPEPGTVFSIPTPDGGQEYQVQGIPGRTYKTERGARIAAGRLLAAPPEPEPTAEPEPEPPAPAPAETLTYKPRF